MRSTSARSRQSISWSPVRPISQAIASISLYTSESENSRPRRSRGSRPSTAASKLPVQPIVSTQRSQCRMIAVPLSRCRSAQKPPVIRTSPMPTGRHTPAAGATGRPQPSAPPRAPARPSATVVSLMRGRPVRLEVGGAEAGQQLGVGVQRDGGDPGQAGLVALALPAAAEPGAEEHRVVDQPPADQQPLLLEPGAGVAPAAGVGGHRLVGAVQAEDGDGGEVAIL